MPSRRIEFIKSFIEMLEMCNLVRVDKAIIEFNFFPFFEKSINDWLHKHNHKVVVKSSVRGWLCANLSLAVARGRPYDLTIVEPTTLTEVEMEEISISLETYGQ